MRADDEVLHHLEESLWRSETRFDRDYLEGVLADDFLEVGRSGHTHTRVDIIATPEREIGARLPLPDFEVRFLTPDVALATYTSEVGTNPVDQARRSSVWRKSADGWRIEFHQGTPLDTLAPDDSS